MNRDTLRADMMAGLTGATLVLPQGVAFATIAGMPPEYGLYASIVPAIIAALFGSSWHLVSGPTTAASIVMFSSLSSLAEPGSAEYISLAITLALMVGVVQLVMGLARMGTLVNFISPSVIVGFTAGAACLIAAKQARTFLGLEIPETDLLYDTLAYLWYHWYKFHPLVTIVSVTTLVSAVLLRMKWPKFPNMIGAMVIGSAVAVFFNWFFGEAATGIEMVGALPRALPPSSTPDLSIAVIKDLAPLTFAMTLFALTEAVSISRSISMKSGQPIEGNQEFIGQGLSNIAGSFFSSYVATGSFNRSAANYDAGARTPLAAVLAGVLLLPLILLVAPFTAYLPKAAVAGLLFLVAFKLIDFGHIRTIVRADKKEAIILGVTFFGTLFLELEFAILLGVMLSLMFFLRNTSRPRVMPRVPDPNTRHRKFTTSANLPECPQMKILRLDDSLYFGSVTHVREMFRRYREHYPQQKFLFLLTKGVAQVDVAGAELLIDEVRERRKMGGDLVMYRLRDSAARVLGKGGYLDVITESNIVDTKEDGIAILFDRLDKDICARCEKRIFLECRTVERIKEEPGPDQQEIDESASGRLRNGS